MHRNADLIHKFYESFGNRDAGGMAACYHPDVKFSDEVFPDLEGIRAVGMWQMLCDRGKDLKVEVRDVEADDSVGRAHWEAWLVGLREESRPHASGHESRSVPAGARAW